MGTVNLDRPWQFVGPNGTRFWSGMLLTGLEREVVCSTAVAVPINPGMAVVHDPRGPFPRWDVPVTSDPPKATITANPSLAADETAFIGVAHEHIPVGKLGTVAGRGTICAVNSLTAASLASNLLGAAVIGSVTIGSVDCVTAAAPAVGTCLGMVVAIAGTGFNGSGSLTQLIIEVNPY